MGAVDLDAVVDDAEEEVVGGRGLEERFGAGEAVEGGEVGGLGGEAAARLVGLRSGLGMGFGVRGEGDGCPVVVFMWWGLGGGFGEKFGEVGFKVGGGAAKGRGGLRDADYECRIGF